MAASATVDPRALDRGALQLIEQTVRERPRYVPFEERFPHTARAEKHAATVDLLTRFLAYAAQDEVVLAATDSDEFAWNIDEKLAADLIDEYFEINRGAVEREVDAVKRFRADEDRAFAAMCEDGDMVKLEIDILSGRHTPEVSPVDAPPVERYKGIRSDALVAVLVPVLMRPQNVAPLLDSFHRSTTRANIYFIVGEDDRVELDALIANDAQYFVVPADRRSWAKKINDGYKRTHEPWLLCVGDDVEFRAGWLEQLEKVMADAEVVCGRAPGVIGTNDLGNPSTILGTSSTHPLVSRAYADEFGTIDGPGAICFEGYHHNFPDTELVATAKQRGLYSHARFAFVEHMHPIHGKGADDEVYKLGASRQTEDRALFEERSARFGWS